MKRLILFTAIFLLPLLTYGQSEIGESNPESVINSNKCPSDNEWTKENIETFLTDPAWTPERQETGTVGVNSNQLQVLSNNNNQDKTTCEFFNNEFTNTIAKAWDDGNPMYKIAYYRAGNFYIVSTVVAQPADQDWAAVGLSFIGIFDENLNHIKGYAF